ncbi:MAG: hypothetical protein A2527_08885 [Candidatus Lambdaproteobacteria bacterium RIFOXYD2_FULL_50_16]|uniref:Flagellar protein FlgN n=1 Tax=Candidatus Lambdaproteobacteria bacterium RIFOXYD2_FULL_50_16 TaxID=1817772 RepID=A0A1F6GAY7_9PROT|nr:MAG: hypothetical protein A2527_08885 [Candidatus Lambdaproteobacteria bacterium RIFOXYD2_FULL_50_16]
MILDTLIENLESQVEWHQMLLDILGLEGELDQRVMLNDLEDVLCQRDRIGERIKALEGRRQTVVAKLIDDLALPPATNLEGIAQVVEPLKAEKLRKLKNQLLSLIGPIRDRSRKNAERAQARLNCFTEVYDGVQKTFDRRPTYSPWGQMKKPHGSVFLAKSV